MVSCSKPLRDCAGCLPAAGSWPVKQSIRFISARACEVELAHLVASVACPKIHSLSAASVERACIDMRCISL